MYKTFLLFCIFITGMVSLVYQMVWQRYLAILVGSEARSAALVVAIFLLGLSLGYALFGYLTTAKVISTRKGLLKFYGWVEFFTAVYVIVFPHYFVLLQKLSFNGPISLIFDMFVIVVAILLPTIFMGATIPLMTMIFPQSKDKQKNREIDTYHAQIYGVNTLGAFIGCLGGGYLLIPTLGLPYSLFLMGVLNFLVSFVYIFNSLSGKLIPKSRRDDRIIDQDDNSIGNFLCYALVFVVGAITIGLEILLIRIVALTIGSNVYVFPTVLAIVVLGIGLGSLRIVKYLQKAALNTDSKQYNHLTSVLKRLLLSCVFLTFFFWSVPYLPSVINHIRVSLVTIPLTQFVYLGFIFIILSIPLIPAFYLLGGLLPLTYCVIDKNQKNYGKVCGYLYFFNTIGALVGAVILGYWLLHFYSIEDLFKFCIYTLLMMGVILSFTPGVAQDIWSLNNYKLKSFVLSFIIFYLGFMILMPQWDRRHHYVGLFRGQEKQSYHFQSWFLPKSYAGYPVFIEDGPNSTIAVLRGGFVDETTPISSNSFTIPGPDYEILSIIVNGKSDGSSWGDFPTVYATAFFPYLFAPSTDSLRTAVIGFGTGITAGTLGRLADVQDVQTIEISSVLARRHAIFDPVNFLLSQNSKVSVIETDAFKFLTHSKTRYDLIASEASNPWVVGVENLFALEFYESVANKLTRDGVLAQWFHTYSMNLDLIKMIFDNLSFVFPYVKSYTVGSDMVILAKKTPFADLGRPSPVIQRRFTESLVTRLNEIVGIKHLLNIKALELTNEVTSLYLGSLNSLGFHTLEQPKLTFGANKAFFLDESVSVYDITNHSLLTRHFYEKTPKLDAILQAVQEENPSACPYAVISHPFCPWYSTLTNFYGNYNQRLENPRESLIGYSQLRSMGYIPKDESFLTEMILFMLENFNINTHNLLIKELYAEELYDKAGMYLSELQKRSILTQAQVVETNNTMRGVRDILSKRSTILERLNQLHPEEDIL